MKFMTYSPSGGGGQDYMNQNVFGIDFILRCDLGISKLAE